MCIDVARRTAVKAQQATWREIGAIPVNARGLLRDRLRGLPRTALLAALVATRPSQISDPDHADIVAALRALARRHRDLAEEDTIFQARLRARTTTANLP